MDFLDASGPRAVAAQAIIGKVSVHREGRPTVVQADLSWRLDHTRHREVEASAEAFSRFSRPFTEQRTAEVTRDPPSQLGAPASPRRWRVTASGPMRSGRLPGG